MNMNQANLSPTEPLPGPLDQSDRLLNGPPDSHMHLFPAAGRLVGPRAAVELMAETLRWGEPGEVFFSGEDEVGVEGLQ